jgi:hypothetical protein
MSQKFIATFGQLIDAAVESNKSLQLSTAYDRAYYTKKMRSIYCHMLEDATADDIKKIEDNTGGEWTEAVMVATLAPSALHRRSVNNSVYIPAVIVDSRPLLIYISKHKVKVFHNQTRNMNWPFACKI